MSGKANKLRPSTLNEISDPKTATIATAATVVADYDHDLVKETTGIADDAQEVFHAISVVGWTFGGKVFMLSILECGGVPYVD